MKDLIESLAFFAMLVVAMWLYCAATPDQLSAEADWTAESEVAK